MKNNLIFPSLMLDIMGICGIWTMTPYGIYAGIMLILLGIYVFCKGFNFNDNSPIDPKEDPIKYISKNLNKADRGYTIADRYSCENVYDSNGYRIDCDKYERFVVKGHKLELLGIKDRDICFVTTKENSINYKEGKEHPLVIFKDCNICQIAYQGKLSNKNAKKVYEKCLEYRENVRPGITYETFKDKIKNKFGELKESKEIVIAFKYDIINNTDHVKEWYFYNTDEIVGYNDYYFNV